MIVHTTIHYLTHSLWTGKKTNSMDRNFDLGERTNYMLLYHESGPLALPMVCACMPGVVSERAVYFDNNFHIMI